MTPESENPNRVQKVLWILLACLLVSTTGTIGLFVWVRLSKRDATLRSTTASQPAMRAASGQNTPASFAELAPLAESLVPGRYKIDEGGKGVMHIVLNEDHTFINRDGTTYLTYQWEVSPNSLVITWQQSSSVFTDFEQLGVYSRKRSDGSLARMEKLPDLPGADTIIFKDEDVIASMAFTSEVQGRGLVAANTEGDGAIHPGDAGGQECYHLRRIRGRMSAYLYGRIAPELKTEPFTNAFITVEYFDSPARDPRNGWIVLQFDAQNSPYTSTAQRVKLSGTMKWTRATFVLDAPIFTGRENDSADFRLCVADSDLAVRSLKLVKNKPLPR